MKIISSMLAMFGGWVFFISLALSDPGTTWEKQFNNPGRFMVLSTFNKEAVFDRETGRVWERSPDGTNRNWVTALAHCYTRVVGGRKGWRLPSIEELASLVDLTQSNPTLPGGHPFIGVQNSRYWSATTVASDQTSAWPVDFSDGLADGTGKTNELPVWCVRGGQGIDGVQ